MSFVDWTICPNKVTFDYNSGVLPPAFGRKDTRLQSPNWFMRFDFHFATDEKLVILNQLRYQSPTGLFNIYDPRRPYPEYWRKAIIAGKFKPETIVPPATVSAMDALDGTITVKGQAGDRIIAGDRLGFTYDELRYHFRAVYDLVLDGTDQVLPVLHRPYRNETFAPVTLDRIKPTMRFHVQLNGLEGSTGLANITQMGALEGIEWTRKVTENSP